MNRTLTQTPAEVASGVNQSLGDGIPLPTAAGVFLMTNSFETGGSERQFLALARALDPERFQVELGCCQRKGALLEEAGAVHHFGFGGSVYRLRSLQSRYRLSRHLRGHSIAIAHAFDFYSNLMLVPAAKLARTPVVIASQRQLGDLLTPAQRKLQLAMFRRADAVICNSRAAAERLAQQGLAANQLHVIGNGLAASAFEKASPCLARQPGIFRIGMIARMNTRSKNHAFVLEAAARLRNRIPQFEVILVGDGPLRVGLERQAAELGLADRVHFLGDRRDISAILASLDVTVLPSASESLSNAILESMAAGVPVIASRVGGNEELISDTENGLLIQVNDLDAMENALVRMHENAGWRDNLGRNAKRFAQENFTIDRMRISHEQLYADLMERKAWRINPIAASPKHGGGPRKLRVAIVAASLRYVGGQSVQAEALLKNWRNDPEVCAEFVPIDPALPGLLRWVERIPGLRTLVREPIYALALRRGLKDADIAHIFSAGYWSFLVAPVPAWLIARLHAKKVILHYHSGEARDHLQRFRTAGPMMKRMDAVIVPSQYLVKVFEEFDVKAEVVPNVVDFSQFRFRPRIPLRPHLVCTRGFHPYYRVDLVVRAFARVQQDFPNAQLDLAGAGPEETNIRDLVRELQLSHVRFLGVISHAEMNKAYDDADIFVNASSVDNMPVSILEAFASGTPVASTAPEGIRYLVEHEQTGLLSAPEDSTALAHNLLRLLNEPGLSERLAANARTECERYQWGAVREQWLAQYRKLVSVAAGAGA